MLGSTGPWSCHGHNHVDLEPDQLGRHVAEPFLAPLRIAGLHDEVLALDIPEVAQCLQEGPPSGTGLSGQRSRSGEPIFSPAFSIASGLSSREDVAHLVTSKSPPARLTSGQPVDVSPSAFLGSDHGGIPYGKFAGRIVL